MALKIKPLQLFNVLLSLCVSFTLLQGDIHYYVIEKDEDDGMEWNDTVWMASGYSGDEPNTYLGRHYSDFSDTGFRFHLDDIDQGERFVLARLKFITTASSITSRAGLIIKGIGQDGTQGFSQDNRPSQQQFLTWNRVTWEITDWHVYEFPQQNYPFYVECPLYEYSPDISSIINEILARPGWGSGSEGKTVSILIDEANSSWWETNNVAFEDFYIEGEASDQGRPVTLELYETVIDTFLGGPVLSKPTSGSITVSLVPQMTSDFYVEFGTSPGNYTLTTVPVIGFGGYDMDSVELDITGLVPDTRYYYRLRARKTGDPGGYEEGPEYSFMTKRTAGQYFNFVFLTDSHIGVKGIATGDDWKTGFRTIENAMAADPDLFLIGGDDGVTKQRKADGMYIVQTPYDAFLRYSQVRRYYGPLANTAPVFLLLGNHDGEGSYQDSTPFGFDLQALSYQARSNFFLNPDNATYAFGSGPKEDYFAWEWGDALFVVINPFSYTGSDDPIRIEPYGSGWHLGDTQLLWLENVLSTSTARWKFIFSHHILASWEYDGYGRGGARYAHDHEQGVIHQMMLDYGAQIFFYGHDHVFADGIADGVHYTACSKPIGYGAPPWADDPFFIDAYPYGHYTNGGHINVRVGPRCVRVDFVNSSLDDRENGEVIYSYHLADVTVKLIPATKIQGDMLSSLTDPSFGNGPNLSGDTIHFEAIFSNDTERFQFYDYWITLSLPGGRKFVYDLEENKIIGPNTSEIESYNIPVPTSVDPESCAITAEAGNYPDDVISRDSFGGETMGSAGREWIGDRP